MPSGRLTVAERLRRLQRPNLQIDRAYASWLRRERAGDHPATGRLISVAMPVFDPPPRLLDAAIGSVRAQGWRDWELCIVDDASTSPDVACVLDGHRAAEPRIRVVRLPRNAGIARASNVALEAARGEYVALLDHDDLLAPHALARVAAEIAAHPGVDLVFSDEDKLVGGVRCAPYFKPGWDPVLMLGQNLVSHLGVYRRAAALEAGGFREGLEGSQDYDLALRVAAAGAWGGVRHIPEVLYHWRQLAHSFSATQAERASRAAREAVAGILDPGATVEPDPMLPQWNRVRRPVPEPPPLVSLVLAPGGAAPADPAYPWTERVEAADRAAGAVLVFLAAGLTADGTGWLGELVGQAMTHGVGAVGARLDRPDGRIFEAGLVLDRWRVARALRPRSDLDDPGYVGHFRLARTVSALSGDALAVRRDVFEGVGGLDAACGRYADVDLCLRLARAGLRCVWTPHARLRHAATPWARPDHAAARLMRARWGDSLVDDPHLSPNLAVRGGTLVLRTRLARPPAHSSPRTPR